MYAGASGEQTQTPAPADCQQIYHMGIRDRIRSGQTPPIPVKDAAAVMSRHWRRRSSRDSGAVAPASTDVRGARRVGLAADS
jgi:hypothetical protein